MRIFVKSKSQGLSWNFGEVKKIVILAPIFEYVVEETLNYNILKNRHKDEQSLGITPCADFR